MCERARLIMCNACVGESADAGVRAHVSWQSPPLSPSPRSWRRCCINYVNAYSIKGAIEPVYSFLHSFVRPAFAVVYTIRFSIKVAFVLSRSLLLSFRPQYSTRVRSIVFVKMFSCNICQKTFTTKRSLVRHTIIHSGVRFQCGLCPKSFTRKTYLDNHMKIHRQTVGPSTQTVNHSIAGPSNNVDDLWENISEDELFLDIIDQGII